MKRLLLATLLLTGFTEVARATATGGGKLFDVSAPSDEAVQKAITKLESACAYSMMSRIGPTPGQMRACNDAEDQLVAMGRPAAEAALARLDDPSMRSAARHRLYDTVGRVGDLAMVEPVLRGLDRIAAEGIGGPHQWEKEQLVGVLRQLTYADPKGSPELAWRAWWNDHKTLTRPQLFALRVDAARKEASDADEAKATDSAMFLANQGETRKEGLDALRLILARPSLTAARKQLIQYTIERLERAPVQKAIQAKIRS